MKTVAAPELAKAYASLYPAECKPENQSELEAILSKWLETYSHDPSRMISVSNWYGKVTKALFQALGEKQPKTKTLMLESLS